MKYLSNKTNSDLTYILEYCPDGDLKNRAWEVLATKNPTNSELTYILRYCPDGDLKNRAWEVLATKNPTNSELTYILEYCPDGDLKNRAGEVLNKNLGVIQRVNEDELIRKIADRVINHPCDLKMGDWHCGTAHCLAGWACVLDETAMRVERQYSTEIAGAAVIPSYAYLFFSDNETVLEVLKNLS